MAHVKRKTPAAAAASSSSASDDIPVGTLRKKLKGKKNLPESKSTSGSSEPSKAVEPTVSMPEKKKKRQKPGIDTQRKMRTVKSSGSVDKALLDCKFIKWEYFNQKRFEKGGSSSAKVGSDSTSEFLSEIQGLRAAVNDHFSSTHQSIDILRKYVDVIDYKVSHLLTQNEKLTKLIVDLQQAKETGFPTKVEAATQVSADKGASNKVGESPAAVAHESDQVAEPELEPAVEAPVEHASEQVIEPEIGPATGVPTEHDSEKVVDPESELPVEPPSAPSVEPAAAPTQQQEATLKDHQASAPSQLSAAAAPAAKKGKKRSKSTVSNPYQSLAAALQPPSDEDEPQKDDQVADQGSQPPAAKPTRKKLVPSKSTRRSKRLK
ncbi:uncharacterized protein LOC131171197 [Hevea brasiliensis]|uniref:uncharacterized protein LOC131171197 n=1 Tax=Hevea brasiliensis TaxID=3981 RepID=UPI0025FF8E8B|nr:uncharacterized protein LOC131171197 [Hevea brasiliensis]